MTSLLLVPAASYAATLKSTVTINFARNSSSIGAAEQKKLSKETARILALKVTNIQVTVKGFTRASGATAKDKTFALSRAAAVAAQVKRELPSALVTSSASGRVKTNSTGARKVVVSFSWQNTAVVTPPSVIIGAPTNLSVIPSDKTLTVSFVAPVNTDPLNPVTGYEYQITGSTSWTASTSLFSPLVIKNLTNTTAYSLQIRAVTAKGAGVASQFISGTPVSAVPSAPSNLSATPGIGFLSISFFAGFNGGTPISGYEYSLNGGSTWASPVTPTTASPVVIRGLTGGVTYSQILIRALNANGAGAASTAVSGTPTVSVPSAPTNLSAVAGDSQLTISFTPSVANGSIVTNYQYSLDGGTTAVTVAPAVTASPIVITGLMNGALYPSIKLRAVSAAGSSAWSSSVSGKPTIPASAPTAIVVTPGNTELSIAFTPGSSTGSAITNYEYTFNGGTTWTSLRPADATSPIVITGLTNGSLYSIRIRAVNASGPGTASAIFTGTPASVPGAPTYSYALPGDQKITVALSNTDNTGGTPVTSYEYSINNGTSWTSVNAPLVGNLLVISGLTNGVAYSQVKIRAVNAVGAGTAITLDSATPTAG